MDQPFQTNRPGKTKKTSAIDNLITCSKCGFVYDTRFLAEHCRMVDGEGFRCQSCNALLLDV